MRSLFELKEKPYLRWALIALVFWILVDLVYILSGINWLKDTDAGWYWRTVLDLGSFDPAIQIGYPLICRALMELFPSVSPPPHWGK
jgi:hypothetical protein